MILAGGRGTRFWPLSRQRRAKQLLALDGQQTMIQQTVGRLLPLASRRRFWVITNQHLRREIMRQLPRLGPKRILAEPAGRNTAPAIGLAAFILMKSDPDAVIGLFPSDHVIADEKGYREVLKKGIEIAAAGENIVVLAIRPTRPRLATVTSKPGPRFGRMTSRAPLYGKAGRNASRRLCAAGNYFWNSGMFLWSARTLAKALRSIYRRPQRCCSRLQPRPARENLPPRLPTALSQMREHQHRLCRARTALKPGRAELQHHLPSRRFWME